jgi:hypothetical protein
MLVSAQGQTRALRITLAQETVVRTPELGVNLGLGWRPDLRIGRGAVLSATTVRAFRETYLMNIYVGNLAYGVTQDELREAFAAYGEVESANLITDKFTGESKGFGFVEMPNNSEADAAIKALNEQPLKGRPMRVNQAKPRSDRGPRGGGGGSGGGRRW